MNELESFKNGLHIEDNDQANNFVEIHLSKPLANARDFELLVLYLENKKRSNGGFIKNFKFLDESRTKLLIEFQTGETKALIMRKTRQNFLGYKMEIQKPLVDSFCATNNQLSSFKIVKANDLKAVHCHKLSLFKDFYIVNTRNMPENVKFYEIFQTNSVFIYLNDKLKAALLTILSTNSIKPVKFLYLYQNLYIIQFANQSGLVKFNQIFKNNPFFRFNYALNLKLLPFYIGNSQIEMSFMEYSMKIGRSLALQTTQQICFYKKFYLNRCLLEFLFDNQHLIKFNYRLKFNLNSSYFAVYSSNKDFIDFYTHWLNANLMMIKFKVNKQSERELVQRFTSNRLLGKILDCRICVQNEATVLFYGLKESTIKLFKAFYYFLY